MKTFKVSYTQRFAETFKVETEEEAIEMFNIRNKYIMSGISDIKVHDMDYKKVED